MRKDTLQLVKTWFEGLNRGDVEGLLELFGPSPLIRNAAQPLLAGPDAPRRLLTEFFDRTSARSLELIDAAENQDQVFASWRGELTFRPGIRIAEVTLPHEIRVPLRGVERFRLDTTGRITELDIVHETTSVAQAALKAASAAASNSGTSKGKPS